LDKIGGKLNECLTKKGVKDINTTEILDSMHAHGRDENTEQEKEEEGFEKVHKMISAKIAIAKGVTACATEKFSGDTTKVKPLEQCLHDNKKSLKPKICAALKPCIGNVSADCQKRGEEVHKAICECKKEKEAEIATKLATLGKQDKVSIKELVQTVLGDKVIDEIITQVDACYKDNNEEEPAVLKLILATFGGNSTSPPVTTAAPDSSSNSTSIAHFQVDGKEIQVMSDMLSLGASDTSECEPCQ